MTSRPIVAWLLALVVIFLASRSRAADKGVVVYETSSPARLAHRDGGADKVRALVRSACPAAGLTYRETSYLVLRRGPYAIAAGLDDSPAGAPHVLHGHFVDLFDAGLPILESVKVSPGSRHPLIDLDPRKSAEPAVVASACKILGAKNTPGGSFRFYAEGPDKIQAVVRIALAAEPVEVALDEKPLPGAARVWDATSKTLLLRFPNSESGHWIEVFTTRATTTP